MPTTKEELLPLYRQMLVIRRLEEAAAKAYSQGKIGGFLHLVIGQEAVCVGAIAALRARGLRRRDLPRARPRLRQGRRGAARSWPSSTARRPDCVQGPRRLDAPLRQEDQLPRRLRHRRRPHPARGGRGLRVEVPRRRARHPVLLRRGRVHDRRLRRGHRRSPRCGSCPSCSSARTTSTRWARRSSGRWPSRTSRCARSPYGMARDRFDGDDVLKVKRRIAEAVERARDDRRADAGRDRHVPLPRSLDDATRACTAPRKRSRSGSRRDPLNRAARRLLPTCGVTEAELESARGRRQGRGRGRRAASPRRARRPTSICPT